MPTVLNPNRTLMGYGNVGILWIFQ